MDRSKLESVFFVAGILISLLVFKGQCSRVKHEKDYISFPKAFFWSNSDQLKTFLTRNSIIEHHTSEEGMTSSQKLPMSPSSDETAKSGGEDTIPSSSPGLSTKPVTENRDSKEVMMSPQEQPFSASSYGSISHGDHHTSSAASSPGSSTELATDVPQWHLWNHSFYTFVYTTNMTWEEAANACSSMREGAHLVFIESRQENEEVARLAKVASKGQNERWWIGLTDKDTEGVFIFRSPSHNLSLDYSNWNEGQPDSADLNEDCVELGFVWIGDNAFWNDIWCTLEKPFICEKDLETIIT